MSLIDNIPEFNDNVKDLIRQVCGSSTVKVVDPADVCKNINEESVKQFKIDFNKCADYIKWKFYRRAFVNIRVLTLIDITFKLHSMNIELPFFKRLEYVFGKEVINVIGNTESITDFHDIVKCCDKSVNETVDMIINVVDKYKLKVYDVKPIEELKRQIEQFDVSDINRYMTCKNALEEVFHAYESRCELTSTNYKKYISDTLNDHVFSFTCCNGREQTVNVDDVPFNVDFILQILTDCENEYIECHKKVFGKSPPNDYYILAVFVDYFKEILPRYRIDDFELYKVGNYNLSEVVNDCVKRSIVDPDNITFAKLVNLYVSRDKSKLYKMKVMLASLLVSYFKHDRNETIDLEIVKHCKSIYTYLLYADEYRDVLNELIFNRNTAIEGIDNIEGIEEQSDNYIDGFDFDEDDSLGMTGSGGNDKQDEHVVDEYSNVTSDECIRTIFGLINDLNLQCTDINSYDDTSITVNDIINKMCDYSGRLCSKMHLIASANASKSKNKSNAHERLSEVETILTRSTNVGKFTEVIFAIDLPNNITEEIKEMFTYYLEAINEFSHLLKNINANVDVKIVLPNHNVRIGVMRTIARLLTSATHFVGQDDDDCSASMENISEMALTEFTSNPKLMILDYEIYSGIGYTCHANQLCSRVMNSKFMSLLGLYTTTWYSNLDDGIFSHTVKTIQLLHYAFSYDVIKRDGHATLDEFTFYKMCNGVTYYFLEASKSCIDNVNGYPSEGELLLYQSKMLGLPLNSDLATTYVLCKTFIMIHLNREVFNIKHSLYPNNYCDTEVIRLGIDFSNADELRNKLQYPTDYAHFFAVVDYFIHGRSQELSQEPKRECTIFGYFGTIRPDRKVKVIMDSGQFFVIGRIDDIEYERGNSLEISDFNKLTMQKPYKMFGSNETFRMSISKWNKMLTGGESDTPTSPFVSTRYTSSLFKLFITFLFMLTIVVVIIVLISLIIIKYKNKTSRSFML